MKNDQSHFYVLKEAILGNTDVRLEAEDNLFVPHGEPIEVGMIKFLIDTEFDMN